MIDPQFMDETLKIDRTKSNERYKAINEDNLPQVEPQIEFDTSYVPGTEDFRREEEQAAVQQTFQEQRPPRLSRPGRAAGTDEPAFEGGPLQSEVLAWKKQFGHVYMTELEGEMYIWRRINRYEYKEVMNVINTNELIREEMLCEVCVLFPFDYTYESMVNAPGGIPSLLAEQIMMKSGFTKRAKVTLL